ncbi:hypothetical protein [Pseudobacteriovorax antillogorgiicola]|uniref:Uncharacterized protein n=1 Tax=Pseudobacteriovorax antillogorgiicola TaxID=1513793 RepID=A0A1Y6BAZ7_9BACT|nr:hypothetical protein [Pseudobacteriovorax antillogorgiicola]TCS59136.1 hypothetical protein EDD56_10139 [Pseudobacteriovorax antillogorgiicola]SME91302.1 hypothetical protein SAMN06296036_101447 [Pseudobacteriovorax antillogorgiicola]
MSKAKGSPRLLSLVIGVAMVASCKFQPNQLRSTHQAPNVYQFLVKGSIKFDRSAAQTGGDLSFQLTNSYSCGVEYWADDLNQEPQATAPKYVQCPEGNLSPLIFIPGLDPSVPYTFKLMVWPKSLTVASAAYIVLKERLSLSDQATDHIIFHNYNAPRQSGETYTFLSSGETSLLELRNELLGKYPVEEGITCQAKQPIEQNFNFTRNRSLDDGEKRPLHGLRSLSTDGYAIGPAKQHSFFETRLKHFFSSVERLKNWQWNFQWEDLAYEFTTFPPGHIEDLSIKTSQGEASLGNRDLLGTLPSYEVGEEAPEFNLNAIFPGQINFVHVEIKDPFARNRALYCSLLYENSTFIIPEEPYKSLDPGNYDITVIFESIQIHYKSNLPYPPWVITSQDWIHAKIKKVL